MPEVTINAADLEALLFAAGAANGTPEAKKILMRDAQFESAAPRLGAAIKNAGDAWRKANRAQEWPERFVIEPHELDFLKRVAGMGAASRFGMIEPINDTIPRPYITKSLLEYGIYSEQVTWSTSGDTDQMSHAERRVRLTGDARQILKSGAFDAAPPKTEPTIGLTHDGLLEISHQPPKSE